MSKKLDQRLIDIRRRLAEITHNGHRVVRPQGNFHGSDIVFENIRGDGDLYVDLHDLVDLALDEPTEEDGLLKAIGEAVLSVRVTYGKRADIMLDGMGPTLDLCEKIVALRAGSTPLTCERCGARFVDGEYVPDPNFGSEKCFHGWLNDTYPATPGHLTPEELRNLGRLTAGELDTIDRHIRMSKKSHSSVPNGWVERLVSDCRLTWSAEPDEILKARYDLSLAAEVYLTALEVGNNSGEINNTLRVFKERYHILINLLNPPKPTTRAEQAKGFLERYDLPKPVVEFLKAQAAGGGNENE